MNKEDMIYDLLKEVKEEIKEVKRTADTNAVILKEHQRRSLANEDRLELLEKHAVQINWKSIAVLFGILSSASAVAFYVVKILALL